MDKLGDIVGDGALDQQHGGESVDLPIELRIEVGAGVVGDVGQMQDRIHAGHGNAVGVAYVLFDYREARVGRQVVAEPLKVDHGNGVAGFEKT